MDKDNIIEQIEQTDALILEAKKKYYLENFYEFNRDILGWPDIYEPLHRKVCNFVQNNVKKKKLLILMPRGSFKSSIVTIGFSLWRIAQNPGERIMLANATYPMACQFLSQIKNHLTRNKKFIELFGHLAAEADTWRENCITVSREKSYEKKEPTIWAFGGDSNVVGSHYSVAILDDMVNDKTITTREQIDKTIAFYRNTLDLVDPNKGGNLEVIVIGTTWDYSDLYAWILDEETNIIQDFEILKMPAYTGEWKKGKLLFPPRLTWKHLEEKKRQQGSSHFNAQYMLDPVPLEDALFKFQFKYYDQTDITGLQLNKFVTIDPALSQKKEADYSAMTCIGIDKNNDWYVLDLWRDKVNPKRLLDQIFYWDDKWKPIAVGIETTAFQKTLQFFAYEEMKRRNHHVPLKELVHTDQSKDQRIRGLEPRYETGSVFHNKLLAYNDTLEDELRRFPKGKNDDMIDALASQLEIGFPSKVAERRQRKHTPSAYPA